MIALLIILGVMAYGGVAGATYTFTLKSVKSNCHNCSRGYCSSDHPFGCGIAAAGWPIGLPAMVGSIIADKDKRTERKAKRELREANQKIELLALEKKRILMLEQMNNIGVN